MKSKEQKKADVNKCTQQTIGLAKLYHGNSTSFVVGGSEPITKASYLFTTSLTLYPLWVPSYILCYFLQCQFIIVFMTFGKSTTLEWEGQFWGGTVALMSLYYPSFSKIGLEDSTSGSLLVLKVNPNLPFHPTCSPLKRNSVLKSLAIYSDRL